MKLQIVDKKESNIRMLKNVFACLHYFRHKRSFTVIDQQQRPQQLFRTAGQTDSPIIPIRFLRTAGMDPSCSSVLVLLQTYRRLNCWRKYQFIHLSQLLESCNT